jgi:putative transposase
MAILGPRANHCSSPVGTVESRKDKTDMPHTYASLFFHCVFSTKERRPWLTQEIRDQLWPFMGGIARVKGFVAVTVGGTEDHAHMLISLPTTMAVAKAVQLVKAGSSGWVSKTFPHLRDFQWQGGYGAFSISISHKADTIAYIERQEEHHRRKTFKEEYIEFLDRHGITYDERYIWD